MLENGNNYHNIESVGCCVDCGSVLENCIYYHGLRFNAVCTWIYQMRSGFETLSSFGLPCKDLTRKARTVGSIGLSPVSSRKTCGYSISVSSNVILCRIS